jgi:hypothetical protein
MTRSGLLAVAISLLAIANPVHADSITYAETAIGTGNLGSSPFANSLVTITLTSDTSLVAGSPGSIQINFGTATVTVAGVGTATLTDPLLWAFNNPSVSGAGISDVTVNHLILATNNSVFTSYDLRTAIGPISGSVGFNPGFIPTTLGGFDLTSVFGSVSTFSAVVSAVPEPSTVILIGSGLVALVCADLKRRRSSG